MRVLLYGYHYSLLHPRVGSQEPLIGLKDTFSLIDLKNEVAYWVRHNEHINTIVHNKNDIRHGLREAMQHLVAS